MSTPEPVWVEYARQSDRYAHLTASYNAAPSWLVQANIVIELAAVADRLDELNKQEGYVVSAILNDNHRKFLERARGYRAIGLDRIYREVYSDFHVETED